jgi:hypothetical protein
MLTLPSDRTSLSSVVAVSVACDFDVTRLDETDSLPELRILKLDPDPSLRLLLQHVKTRVHCGGPQRDAVRVRQHKDWCRSCNDGVLRGGSGGRQQAGQ